MVNARSLVWYDDEWYEDKICQQPIITDSKFAIDMEDQEGLRFTLTTNSVNGENYMGSYTYEEDKGKPRGTAVFERYKNSRGNVYIGHWRENSSKGEWIIQSRNG